MTNDEKADDPEIETEPEERGPQDYLTDEEIQAVQEGVQTAEQYHDVIDEVKASAHQKATDLRILAAGSDEPEAAEEIERVADMVEGVADRLNEGDTNRVRQ